MNKKLKNLEIERKLKQRRTTSVMIMFVIIGVILAGLIWQIWSVQNRRWVMRFEGQRVSTSDFRFLTFMEDDDEERALNLLKMITLIEQRGERHGVGLTSEEHASTAMMGNTTRWNVIEQFGFDVLHFISDERIGEIFSVLDFVYPRLMDVYIPTYAPSGEEFEEELAIYLETAHNIHAETEAIVIAMESAEELEMVRNVALSGEVPFAELAQQHNMFGFIIGEDEGLADTQVLSAGEIVVQRGLIDWFGNISPEGEIILALQKGEISEVMLVPDIFVDEVYIIVYMQSRVEATEEDIIESFTERFALSRRYEIFFEMLEQMVSEADITVNHRVYAT